MRWAQNVIVRCDYCPAVGEAARNVAEIGQMEVTRWILPKGWTQRVAESRVKLAQADVQIDLFAPSPDVARLSGQMVQAFSCAGCSDTARPAGAQQAGPVSIAEEAAPTPSSEPSA